MANIKDNNNGAVRRQPTDNELSITDMLMICLRHWPWFILSLIVCMSLATLHLLRTPKTYSRTASILVKTTGGEKRVIYACSFNTEILDNSRDSLKK